MFLHGCNYPWSTDGRTAFYGLDFGANIWGTHVGVSTRRPAIDADFQTMAALGLTVVRWFVFTDGRSGIVYDDRGMPLGPDPLLFRDMDAALEIAGAVDIRLCLVLLDHRWMYAGVPERIADPSTGELFDVRLPEGRARVLETSHGRDALMSRLIEQVVRRYGTAGERSDLNGQVFAWELMNEPDFVVEEWEADLSPLVTRPLRFEALAELVVRLGEVVHRHTRALTTMSAARRANLWAWDDDALDVDVLQIHAYPDTIDPRRDPDILGLPASALGVSKPVILGEFPGNGSEQHPEGASPPPTTLEDYLEFALASGYVGAWPWSFSGTDAYGRFPEAALRAFARRHPELVNPRSR
jgi:hypothetical protein